MPQPSPASPTPAEEAELAVAAPLIAQRHHPLVKATEPLSHLADQPPMLALSGATLALGLLAGRPRLAEAGGRVFASVLLATLLKSAVKRSVRRTRPHVLLDEGRYESGPGGSDERSEQSFPSGHTADAAAAARAVLRVYPEARIPVWALAATVALHQTPGAKHYPSDVAAGAVVGLTAEALVNAAWRRAEDAAGWRE